MCRGNWEIAALARHHISDLTSASEARWRSDRDATGPGRLLSDLRQRLGRALIRTGQALAGASAPEQFPLSPIRSSAMKPSA